MSTFPCTYAELKTVAGDFIKAIPSCESIGALDQGLKCVQLHYLGLTDPADHEVAGAAALMRILTDLYIRAEIRINKELHHGNQAAEVA